MTNNEFLKRVFEANPDEWEWQDYNFAIHAWAESDGFNPNYKQRLRPILPDNLPEPPEEAYLYGPRKGGIYTSDVPSRRESFSGWCLQRYSGHWVYSRAYTGASSHYILDVSDPNARAILKALRAQKESSNGGCMMSPDDIQDIKDLLANETDKWRLDAGDWIGFVEELVEEVERLRDELDTIKERKWI